MSYKQKYIKYKDKYLSLKEQFIQKGGNTYTIISNNGTADGNLTNQCLWISIRDYLNYARGITNLKIFDDLKQKFGLGPEFNNTEFNYENIKMRESVAALANRYNIKLCFLPINPLTKKIDLYGINEDGSVECSQGMINKYGKEIVHIASYEGHFALIIAGPGFSVAKHQNSTITSAQTPPHPKISKCALVNESIREGLSNCKTIQDVINLLSKGISGPGNCFSTSVASLRKIQENN